MFTEKNPDLSKGGGGLKDDITYRGRSGRRGQVSGWGQRKNFLFFFQSIICSPHPFSMGSQGERAVTQFFVHLPPQPWHILLAEAERQPQSQALTVLWGGNKKQSQVISSNSYKEQNHCN